MSDEDVATDGAPGDPASPESEPEPQQPTWTFTSALAAYGTLTLAVVGAALFGLLSLGAAIAYSPLGVRPNEIGLGSAALLTQSAAGLIGVTLLAALLTFASTLRVNRGISRRGISISSIGLTQLRRFPPLLAPIWLGLVAALVLIPAFQARSALQDGRKPSSWYGNPWAADVALLTWAHGQPAHTQRLPSCALYLGEAGGTSVVYDADAKQTWRIPSSELIVRAMPSLTECP